ncbi:MAG: HD-GYP domain-containing protein [Burkholderiaceae bacterium]|nr:HD-GYP domain-containing protein [Burkholderiaceae bacterium]
MAAAEPRFRARSAPTDGATTPRARAGQAASDYRATEHDLTIGAQGPSGVEVLTPTDINPADASRGSKPGRSVKRYRITVQHLALGMFVVELDRPWTDTPFVMQGFQIKAPEAVQTLALYCQYVYVDLELSRNGMAATIRAAEAASRPVIKLPLRSQSLRDAPGLAGLEQALHENRAIRSRPHDSRATLEVKRSTSKRFATVFGMPPDQAPGAEGKSWLGEAVDFVARIMVPTKNTKRHKSARNASSGDQLAEIRKLLPPSVELEPYPEVGDVKEELPRASLTFQESEATINALINDIRNGREVKVQNVGQVVENIVDSMISNPDAMMWVAKLRDEDLYTYNHGVKVALYMVALGRHLGLPRSELSHLGMIGMLADVGKTKLPRALLDKPGVFSPEEFEKIKNHVEFGLEVLTANGDLPEEVRAGIAQHHERLDGSGYPHGLEGEQIGIYGRIAGLSDCFAALVSTRPYANPSPPQKALMNLYQWSGVSFHEPLVEQFVQAIGIFPVGSTVELSSGEVAVVLAHNRVRRLEPKVLVLTSADKTALAKPFTRNLLEHTYDREGRTLRIVRGLPTGAFGLKTRDYYGLELERENKLF